MTVRHVIKLEYDDGVKLPQPVAWCGRKIHSMEWRFVDAHHVAMAAGGSQQPCKRCVRAIIKTLEVEL
jgi:hypothetical protein